MVRLTYFLEPTVVAEPNATPVNLAFAAAAAARASWAAKERCEDIWDPSPVDEADEGAPNIGGGPQSVPVGNIRALSNNALQRPSSIDMTARRKDSNSVVTWLNETAVPQSAISRNSMLFHLAHEQQPINNSLLQGPTAPSIMEVASVLETRKERAWPSPPPMGSQPPQPGIRRIPSRAASQSRFNVDIVSGVPNGIAPLAPVEEASFSQASDVELHYSKRISETVFGNLGGPRRPGDTTVSPFQEADEDGVDDDDDRPLYGLGDTAQASGLPADGDASERDGCLVLPVLRTLLALHGDVLPKPSKAGLRAMSCTSQASGLTRTGSHHQLPLRASSSQIGGALTPTGLTRQPSIMGATSFRRRSALVDAGGGGSVRFAKQPTSIGRSTPGGVVSSASGRGILRGASEDGEDVSPETITRCFSSSASSPVVRFRNATGRASLGCITATGMMFGAASDQVLSALDVGGSTDAAAASTHGGVGVGMLTITPTPPAFERVSPPQGSRSAMQHSVTSPLPQHRAQQQQVQQQQASQLQHQGSTAGAGRTLTKTLSQAQPQPPTAPAAAAASGRQGRLFSWTKNLGKGKWFSGRTSGNGTTLAGGGNKAGDLSVQGSNMRPSQDGGMPTALLLAGDRSAPGGQSRGADLHVHLQVQLPPIDPTKRKGRTSGGGSGSRRASATGGPDSPLPGSGGPTDGFAVSGQATGRVRR